VTADTGGGTAPDWDGHLLLLHSSEEQRTSRLAVWVRRGLENDEKVLYTEPPARAGQSSLPAVLRANGVDAAAAMDEGRLSVIPTPEFYPAEGQLPVVERALAEGYRGLRIAVEAKTALMFLTWPALMAAERGIDEVARARPLSAMCQYSRAPTVDGHLSDVVDRHMTGIGERLLSTSGDDGELVLAGEVDMSNEEVLAAALRAATSRAPDTFRLDLRQLGFLSAGGCRAIDEGTRQFRDASGIVLLVGPSEPVADALRLSGVARLDGMKLTGSKDWTR
jgi:anti-anti-sigma factor